MASRARWLSLLSYFLVQFLGAVIAMLLMRVQRMPLPRDEIAALAAVASADTGIVWPEATVGVSAAPGAFSSEGERNAFVQELASRLQGEALVKAVPVGPPGLLAIEPCVAGGVVADSVQGCLESLEEEAVKKTGEADTEISLDFELLVVPASDCSALILGTRRSAVLRWHRSESLENPGSLAIEVAAHLQATWFRRTHFEHTASLFEVAPAYVLSFSLVADCKTRVAWDFLGGVLAPYLGQFLQRLRFLFDFEIDSQVVQCGSLGGSVLSPESVIDEPKLQADFHRRAGEWPGDTVTQDSVWLPPLIRFVAFKPSGNFSVVDSDKKAHRSFAVQGWGAVAVAGPPDAACEDPLTRAGDGHLEYLSRCDAQGVASAWVSHLRSWLTLNPDGPVEKTYNNMACSSDGGLELLAARPQVDGMAEWELLLVARAVHTLFMRRTAETLENLLSLVDSLTDVVVRPELVELASEAAASAQQATSLAAAGDLAGALAASRRGLVLALTASHDDTVVAQLFFSWEFKYAVYLPLVLPIIMPIWVAFFRQLRRAYAVRALRRVEDIS